MPKVIVRDDSHVSGLHGILVIFVFEHDFLRPDEAGAIDRLVVDGINHGDDLLEVSLPLFGTRIADGLAIDSVGGESFASSFLVEADRGIARQHIVQKQDGIRKNLGRCLGGAARTGRVE